MSPTRWLTQLQEAGDGQRRHSCGSDEIYECACPGRGRVPCDDFMQGNEANDPEAHEQARKADSEAIAHDLVPSPQHAPDDQTGKRGPQPEHARAQQDCGTQHIIRL